jgi:hypothetical protein
MPSKPPPGPPPWRLREILDQDERYARSAAAVEEEAARRGLPPESWPLPPKDGAP